ncbi:MAG: SCO family protein [Gammaproteobacteria bacterium]|nr:SCO family protein [Gammaproteobacteria bacterium]
MKKSTIVFITILSLGVGFASAWIARGLQPIKLEAGLWLGDNARALPDFKLIDHNGEDFDRDNLQGKWHLLFFGYTHCPDVCPASLQTMADMLKSISDSDVSNAIRVVFVSVDPDRDTPEVLKNYVQYFNPGFIGITGTEQNLNQLAKTIGISYFLDRENPEQVSYLVSHSSSIILINPSVEYAGLFRAPLSTLAMAEDLTKIIERN